ncbi:unnamed protein product [Calicophoron daubneyi]
MKLKEASRYTQNVPTELQLEPPVFLTGSHARIECSSDGSLPPVPISFSIECPPPPTAVVEHDRVTQAKQSLSYERFYRTYGFRSPPTLADLAPYVARKNADQVLRLGHVSVGKDNKTLRATLSITEKAHDCHVVCRLAGKENRLRLTVYYPTTISYLLPRPRDGYIQVGSEITCYADGHPPPMLSLRLAQPLRPPKPLTREELETLQQVGRIPKLDEEDPITREMTLADSGLDLIPQQLSSPPNSEAKEENAVASSGTLNEVPFAKQERWFNGNDKQPYEDAKRIPGLGLSTVERHRQLGLNPNEYSIQGATFRLAPNATPGVELVLTCTARNVLPGDTTFLGLNGTITRTRFVVAGVPVSAQYIAISYTSLAVSLGVCACVLLILLVIIAAMLLQRRRQGQGPGVGGGRERLANGTKKPKSYVKEPLTKNQSANRPGSPSARLIGHPSADHSGQDRMLRETSFPTSDKPDYVYDPVCIPSSESRMGTGRQSGFTQHDSENLQYAELSFDQSALPGHGANSQTVSLRGRGASSSMTLFGPRPKAAQPPSSFGASVPQGLNIGGARSALSYSPPSPDRPGPQDESSHYTEIVGFMQPKAYSSQLVLQQQHEATQALLAMQQNKPREFV